MANYNLAIKLLPEAVRTVSAASLAGSPGVYLPIGTPLENPARILLIWNLTDQLVMFSFDGMTDNFPIPANGYLLLDIASNSSLSQIFLAAQGQSIYARSTTVAPASGSVYLTSFYGALL